MKTAKCFNITGHDLALRAREVIELAGFTIVELPDELKSQWIDLDPWSTIADIGTTVDAIRQYIIRKTDMFPSIAVIEGDPIACFNMALGCEPIIPVTMTYNTLPILCRPYKLHQAVILTELGFKVGSVDA